jgi:hypothetical protein
MWWSLGIGGRFLSPGVGDRAFHEQPTGGVKEGQAALLGSLAQETHDLGHAFLALAPIAALLVHVIGAARAFAVGRGDDAERPAGEEGFELGAGAVRWLRGLWLRWRESRLRVPRIRRMVNVDRPLVAVLGDDAGHDFVERVATLEAAGI